MQKSAKIFAQFKIKHYFCITISGCSAVRLAHLLWEQGVPGSNPGIPTNEKRLTKSQSLFLCLNKRCNFV